jgi:hypothetical protein
LFEIFQISENQERALVNAFCDNMSEQHTAMQHAVTSTKLKKNFQPSNTLPHIFANLSQFFLLSNPPNHGNYPKIVGLTRQSTLFRRDAALCGG